MSKSFTARVKVCVAAAVLAAATLPGAVNATIQNTQINNYNPALPTISAQELKARIDAYDRGEVSSSTEAMKAATAGGSDKVISPVANTDASATSGAKGINDPAFLARLRNGDVSAIMEMARAQSRGASPSTADAASQKAPMEGANGKSAMASGLAKILGGLQNPQSQAAAIATLSQSSPRFPVNYNDAQDAVRLISNRQAKSVTISGLQSDGRSYNVVDAYGPYASKIQPLDKILQSGNASTAGNEGDAPTYSQAKNAPTNTVTEAAGQAKKGNFDQNPNGVQH